MTKEKQSGPDGAGAASTGSGQALRRRAEEVFREKAAGMEENMGALPPDEVRQILHELRVHQIELEMQNEELRRAQGELEASRVRYFDLYELAPVGYFALSKTGLILEANLTAATLLGVARSTLVKQPLTRFILPEDQDIFYRQCKQLFETGAPQVCELRLVKKDAAPFWVRIDATAVQDPSKSSGQGADGAPVCRATMIDITDRKAAEAALQASSDEVKTISQQLWQAAKLATMGELVSSIAHELNNPLATVSLRVESLIAKTTGDDPSRRELEIIGQEAERMGNLVSNLLQFSHRSQKQISTVAVCEEIEKTLEIIYYHFRKNDIQVIRELAPEVTRILADRQQLRQLFLNLFTNASDAMPGGGTLTIRVYAQGSGGRDQGSGGRDQESGVRDQGSGGRDQESGVRDQGTGGRVKETGVAQIPDPRPQTPDPKGKAFVVVELADTGTGIPPEILSKVMEPFFTTKPEGKGTGLGLAICRRIAQEHGGTLSITSEGLPGKGTKVRITLSSVDPGNSIGLMDP